jgi:hypothetical protein
MQALVSVKHIKKKAGHVVHACNPSDLRGGKRRIVGSRPV